MSDALCRYKWVAPWLGMVLTLVINLVAMGYWSGSIQAHQTELEREVAQLRLDNDRRITSLENSDREQSKWLERIAGMETSINYIRDALHDMRGK